MAERIPAWCRRLFLVLTVPIVVAAATVAVVRAAPASVPNTFTDGDTLSAAAMNANFTALQGAINATSATLATVQQTMLATDANGNVGIGTTSPGARLDVRSTLRVANTDYVPGVGGSTLTIGLGAATGNTYASFDSFTGGGTAFGNIVFHPSGNGRVGVGLASPTATFQAGDSTNRGGIESRTDGETIGALAGAQLVRVGGWYSSNPIPGSAVHLVAQGSAGQRGAIGFLTKPIDDDTSQPATRMVITQTGAVGIATTSPQYALDVVGTIRGDNVTPSDRGLKRNITPLPADTLSRLSGLNGVSFEWDASKTAGYSKRPQIGLIAQDVEKAFPTLVETDGKGIKSIHYMGVTAVLLEAVKAQQKQIEELKNHVRVLENRLSPTAASSTRAARRSRFTYTRRGVL